MKFSRAFFTYSILGIVFTLGLGASSSSVESQVGSGLMVRLQGKIGNIRGDSFQLLLDRGSVWLPRKTLIPPGKMKPGETVRVALPFLALEKAAQASAKSEKSRRYPASNPK